MNESSMQDYRQIKVLIDADLMLEIFIRRDSYIKDLDKLQEIAKAKQARLYITEWCLKKIYMYFNDSNEDYAKSVENDIKNLVDEVVYIEEPIIEAARKRTIDDYESAIEIACAFAAGCDAIVTHNSHNFLKPGFQIWSTEKFLLIMEEPGLLKQTTRRLWYGIATVHDFEEDPPSKLELLLPIFGWTIALAIFWILLSREPTQNQGLIIVELSLVLPLALRFLVSKYK